MEPSPLTTGVADAVDAHAHIFTRDLPRESVSRHTVEYDATAEDYLDVLDAHGFARGVLVQPSFLGTDNSYIVDALRRYPKRLRGVAVADPAISPALLREYDAAGIVGIRLNLIDQPDPRLDAEPWTTLLQRVRDLAWHVEVHCESRRLERILTPLLAAGSTVVVDHFGRPDPALGVGDPGFAYLLSLAPTRRVWVKISGGYRNGGTERGPAFALEMMPLLATSFGYERLVWGSDWPHKGMESNVRFGDTFVQIERLLPDASARRTVLADAAAELFKFGGPR